ncbi:MAG: ATP-binding cassette domain-containing protein, partial [Methanotrichaceae archaeon]|nr:ATP-binding cassette domain-containing protein [Methanotrichaceae archaeon]
IGVVPDISNLYDELSARDNLIFMAKLYGIPRSQREARAEDLLKTFGLYERRNDRFGTFSRGMKRSLTIAAALIHNPKILFLDEPTAGLDVVAARSLRNLISNLCREGMTIFLTTHYLEEADQLCDRIAILVKGRIVKIDTPEGLKCLAQEKQAIEFTFERDITPWREELSRRLRTGMAEINVLASDRVKVYGGEPGRIYDEVFQFSRERGIRLNAVNSVKPSLEDAFMLITGLSPVVMAMEKGGR